MEAPMGSARATSFMATLPPRLIRLSRPARSCAFETIAEESAATLPTHAPCPESVANRSSNREAAPATRVKKAFGSSLDSIREETSTHRVAEHLSACDAAEATRPRQPRPRSRSRPVARIRPVENLAVDHFRTARATAAGRAVSSAAQ